MSTLTIADSAGIDLSSCAREAIHVPGKIQSHGFVLGFSTGGAVTHISKNLLDKLQISAAKTFAPPASGLPGAIHALMRDCTALKKRTDSATVLVAGTPMLARNASADEGFLIDLEPIAEDCDPASMEEFHKNLHALSNCSDIQAIAEHVATAIRQALGYERVMTYRFDSECNGSVIAESRIASASSFLGLHFPAADIPAQARQLYAKNLSRMVIDVNSVASEILSAAHLGPLDLTYSSLRSVSEVHLQYLRNMDVRGSTSFSLIVRGELWGLVACHQSKTVKYLSPQLRIRAEALVSLAALLIASIEEASEYRAESSRRASIARIFSLLADGAPLEATFRHYQSELCGLTDSTGFAAVTDDQVLCCGQTPNVEFIKNLADFLESKIDGNKCFSTSSLSGIWSEAAPQTAFASGIVAVSLPPAAGSPGTRSCMIWFRAEVVSTVYWAGNAEKSVEVNPETNKISPRTSFAAWKQLVHDKSLPWMQSDISAACQFRVAYLDYSNAEQEKKLKESMRQNLEQQIRLDAAARERTAELEANNEILALAKRVAEQAVKSKSEFLANMSHEIRTPLTSIIGFSESMLTEKMSESEKLDAVTSILRNGNHLLNVINDILDYSKIEAQKMEVENVPVNTFDLISNVSNLMLPKAEQKGIAFGFEYVYPLPRFLISDVTRLKQILFNLINNAIKFTAAGSVSVVLSCDATAAVMRFAVRDTGIGLNAEQRERLFQAFSQADTSTTRKFGGTGLGLIISAELARRLGGGVTVESVPGKGSTFTLSVACGATALEQLDYDLPPPAQTRAIQLPKIDVSGLSGSVLVAEDGFDNRAFISFMLRKTGLRTKMVEDGQLAVAAAAAEPFDLILMDMQMPNLDGYDATRLLREYGFTNPIVAITANTAPDDIERCVQAGCTNHLGKPFQRKDFYDVLRLYLSDHGGAASTNTATPNMAASNTESPHRAASNTATPNSAAQDEPIYFFTDEDPELIEIVIESTESIPARLDELQQACEDQNWPKLMQICHDLRGTYFAYPTLIYSSSKLEQAASESNRAQIDAAWEDCSTILKTILARKGELQVLLDSVRTR